MMNEHGIRLNRYIALCTMTVGCGCFLINGERTITSFHGLFSTFFSSRLTEYSKHLRGVYFLIGNPGQLAIIDLLVNRCS